MTDRSPGRLLAGVLWVLLAACDNGPDPAPPRPFLYGGDSERGATLIHVYGCGGCHTIPGVRGAEGMVGPPLTAFAYRSFIAGRLPNEPRNLIRWIMDPQAVKPWTAMPDLGIRETEARHIAAYLYTLDEAAAPPPAGGGKLALAGGDAQRSGGAP